MALTPIRPNGLSVPPPTHPSAEAARTAAQRAFFDAALGRAGAPAPALQTASAVFTPAPIQRPQRMPDPAAEPPTRPLRPGSLLDIRV
jgi:hypothetical protein